jgi:rhodanese-related sulfurtransferase
MFGFLKKIGQRRPPVDARSLVAGGAVIVDVRTPEEYKTGHIAGAVNIPLDRLAGKIESLKIKNKPVITCCRSGARSGIASNMLKNAGIESYNGGSWSDLDRKTK